MIVAEEMQQTVDHEHGEFMLERMAGPRRLPFRLRNRNHDITEHGSVPAVA